MSSDTKTDWRTALRERGIEPPVGFVGVGSAQGFQRVKVEGLVGDMCEADNGPHITICDSDAVIAEKVPGYFDTSPPTEDGRQSQVCRKCRKLIHTVVLPYASVSRLLKQEGTVEAIPEPARAKWRTGNPVGMKAARDTYNAKLVAAKIQREAEQEQVA